MIVYSIGDFLVAYAFGVATVPALSVAWKLWRLVDSARKHARPK